MLSVSLPVSLQHMILQHIFLFERTQSSRTGNRWRDDTSPPAVKVPWLIFTYHIGPWWWNVRYFFNLLMVKLGRHEKVKRKRQKSDTTHIVVMYFVFVWTDSSEWNVFGRMGRRRISKIVRCCTTVRAIWRRNVKFVNGKVCIVVQVAHGGWWKVVLVGGMMKFRRRMVVVKVVMSAHVDAVEGQDVVVADDVSADVGSLQWRHWKVWRGRGGWGWGED